MYNVIYIELSVLLYTQSVAGEEGEW